MCASIRFRALFVGRTFVLRRRIVSRFWKALGLGMLLGLLWFCFSIPFFYLVGVGVGVGGEANAVGVGVDFVRGSVELLPFYC